MTVARVSITTVQPRVVITDQEGRRLVVTATGRPQVVIRPQGIQGPPGPPGTSVLGDIDLGTFN